MEFDRKTKAHALVVINAKIDELLALLNALNVNQECDCATSEVIKNRIAVWQQLRTQEQLG